MMDGVYLDSLFHPRRRIERRVCGGREWGRGGRGEGEEGNTISIHSAGLQGVRIKRDI